MTYQADKDKLWRRFITSVMSTTVLIFLVCAAWYYQQVKILEQKLLTARQAIAVSNREIREERRKTGQLEDRLEQLQGKVEATQKQPSSSEEKSEDRNPVKMNPAPDQESEKSHVYENPDFERGSSSITYFRGK